MNRCAARHTESQGPSRTRPAALRIVAPTRVVAVVLALALLAPTPLFAALERAQVAELDVQAIAAAYGPITRYGIFRKGDRIGTHSVAFEADGSTLEVRIDSSIRVTLLRIPVFRFEYTAGERWVDNALEQATAEVVENGDASRVSLTSDGDSSLIGLADGERSVPRLAVASNHWHRGVLAESRVWNTLTGEASDITIEDVGRGELPGATPLAYTRYRYSGDIEAESWYDDDGRWVGLAFTGEDGSLIEYRLERPDG